MPTASSAFIPSFPRSASSSTSTFSPRLSISFRRRANSSVVSTLAGSFTRSRVKKTPSAAASSGRAAASASSGLAAMTFTSPFASAFFVRCASKS